ncbi:hypothetical protein HaLaN_31967 [Haematococcus lacustris]|uniref:Uncharacterized protein n=1 Tax=Haematococcus lacustris TaxID=44745 RepID=A0A6A0AKZ7_HAELA|nr:hypothetical protein HaLaN_31967 [Haematococcus lacustris]
MLHATAHLTFALSPGSCQTAVAHPRPGASSLTACWGPAPVQVQIHAGGFLLAVASKRTGQLLNQGGTLACPNPLTATIPPCTAHTSHPCSMCISRHSMWCVTHLASVPCTALKGSLIHVVSIDANGLLKVTHMVSMQGASAQGGGPGTATGLAHSFAHSLGFAPGQAGRVAAGTGQHAEGPVGAYLDSQRGLEDGGTAVVTFVMVPLVEGVE